VKKNISIITAIIAAITLLGCEQARVDAQMDELCKKDGGMKIYEKVVLPKDQFKYGVPIFHQTWNTSGGGYRFIAGHERLRPSKPTLTRYTYSVVREADRKTLGVYIVYSRIGGDIMWRPGPDSSKTCPTEGSDNTFLNAIFVSATEGK
jgi:hypothetical protein